MAALPATAPAQSIYAQVLAAYQANGQVPPCQFTSAQLTTALQGVDTYGAQYFADFTDAIQNALAERAGGACLSGSSQLSGRHRQTAASTSFVPPSITGASGTSLPAAILALGGLTLLVGAAAGLAALARRWGWAPSWAAAARHGAGETGYRLAEWRDGWTGRLGRRGTRR